MHCETCGHLLKTKSLLAGPQHAVDVALGALSQDVVCSVVEELADCVPSPAREELRSMLPPLVRVLLEWVAQEYRARPATDHRMPRAQPGPSGCRQMQSPSVG